MTEQKWTGVIGLMSGTSLDGLDCCYVEFATKNGGHQFRNLVAKTYPYTHTWQSDLKNAFYLQPSALDELDRVFGIFLAANTNEFITEFNLNGKVELIASHGHTVFHDPSKKQTVQIGNGSQLNLRTGIHVISDFRIKDVQLGGQGAPLVPVGDHFLFSEYPACLNLGGFSNISFVKNDQRIAFDIGPCNLPINQLCKKHFGIEYDKNGTLAAEGKIIPDLLDALNALPFYRQNPPKSLGFEWLNASFQPLLNQYTAEDPRNLIRTVTQHVGLQILDILEKNALKKVLITGGGAYNNYLVNLLKTGNTEIIIPPAEIIEFKEALIFAFLGYLNLNDTINTFKSVTGATSDSIGGIRHFGHQQ